MYPRSCTFSHRHEEQGARKQEGRHQAHGCLAVWSKDRRQTGRAVWPSGTEHPELVGSSHFSHQTMQCKVLGYSVPCAATYNLLLSTMEIGFRHYVAAALWLISSFIRTVSSVSSQSWFTELMIQVACLRDVKWKTTGQSNFPPMTFIIMCCIGQFHYLFLFIREASWIGCPLSNCNPKLDLGCETWYPNCRHCVANNIIHYCLVITNQFLPLNLQ